MSKTTRRQGGKSPFEHPGCFLSSHNEPNKVPDCNCETGNARTRDLRRVLRLQESSCPHLRGKASCRTWHTSTRRKQSAKRTLVERRTIVTIRQTEPAFTAVHGQIVAVLLPAADSDRRGPGRRWRRHRTTRKTPTRDKTVHRKRAKLPHDQQLKNQKPPASTCGM